MDALLLAAKLRADPPGQVSGVSRVVAGLAFVLAMIPLCSYARMKSLQRVAFARHMPRTAWTTCLLETVSAKWLCSPAVLLSCRALVAQPEDLLGACPPDFVRKVSLLCIALVIPLCQQDRVLCNGRVLDPFCGPCNFSALQAASFPLANSGRDFGTPLIVTSITVPMSWLIAPCHHTIGRTLIFLIVPLSCHQGGLGSQGVMPTHFVAAALRTPTAICPVLHYS